ncbi:NKAP domain containing 1 [Myxocyprinus asiaticus]|uniref:NKAP domain containing 1 n=1 Tax=Myxocyprinus asiaticus TaxID=70543 RepID=UPI002221418E|nr:NKAP domain containing 1 [Myxocyprinus asiaticus]XP_051534866.1 NKAP domain containing 1 [Myxocyprinus asiaticus]XP_051534867.1 NKAP domain containing 1 [Myxocyprinus asiaticus]XP_051534868.1 NKAP domain containing 1 [Myxocyprinus asiaticus]
MSKVPVGKVLLRNVIRHTDAHNKIQEESEMWKLRDLERQASSTHFPKHRGRMHCDSHLDSEGSTQDRLGERLSERDEESRYWTRKLYEFEAKDPDRWGHSGFKELYPEEFQSDGEKDCSDSKHRRKKHKNKLDADVEKNAKKSSKKKKKKKEKKRRRNVGSGPESGSDAEDSVRRKQRRKGGKRKRRKKEHKSKERTEDSSTEDSQSDSAAGKRTKTHRKRDGTKTDTLSEPQRKKRKNWRVANEERSEESSDA